MSPSYRSTEMKVQVSTNQGKVQPASWDMLPLRPMRFCKPHLFNISICNAKKYII
jgi:hypothetical protein